MSGGDDAPSEVARTITVGGTAATRREGFGAAILVAGAVALNLYHLWPEVATPTPLLNDGVLHLQNLGRVVQALATGQDATDPWLRASPGFGYPLLHYYQHLPYLPPALLYLVAAFLFPGALALADVYAWTGYLLLSLFPLSVYWSMRRFGFGRLSAAGAATLAPLLATNGLFGFEYGSYVWRGYGLYPQLWGMLLLPPALAQGYHALRRGNGWFLAVLLLAALLLSHLILAYIGLLSLGVLALLPLLGRTLDAPIGYRLGIRLLRLLVIIGLAALATAYFFWSFLLENTYMNPSVWIRAVQFDSYGWQWVLGKLVTGQLFDFGRLPLFSLCAAAGAALCLLRWREERYRAPLALAAVWLLLYCGRPTWGALLDLLPLSRQLHLDRLLAGVHLAGIMLAGLALGALLSWGLRQRDLRRRLVGAALLALLLLPLVGERAAYLAQNAQWLAQSQAAYAAEAPALAALMDKLDQLPPGRVYAGLAAKWGKDYKVGAVPMYALLSQGGYDTLGFLYHALSLNADVQVLFDDARQWQYNLFDIRYVLTPTDWTVPAYYKPLGDFGRHRLYQVETTGYFDLVGADFALAGDKSEFYPAAAAWLASGLPQAKQHPAVLLGGAQGAYPHVVPLAQAAQAIAQTPAAADAPRGRVVSEQVTSNTYAARVEVQRNSWLLLKATYHPNWHAYVDGVEVETAMLMPSFVGLRLAPGTHDVRLVYQPSPWRAPLLWLGLLTLLLVGLVESRQRLAPPLRRVHLRQVLARLRAGAAALAAEAGEEETVSARERKAGKPPFPAAKADGAPCAAARVEEVNERALTLALS